MDAEIVNKFIESALQVLEAETGGTIRVGQASIQTAPYTTQQVTTLLGVTGNIQGVMLLGLSEMTAKLLVSRMMGQEITELDDLVQSGVAEMGNVIAGGAVTGLSAKGHTCNISPPTLIIGAGTTISTMSIERLALPLISPDGIVEMQLALKINPAPQLVGMSRAALLYR